MADMELSFLNEIYEMIETIQAQITEISIFLNSFYLQFPDNSKNGGKSVDGNSYETTADDEEEVFEAIMNLYNWDSDYSDDDDDIYKDIPYIDASSESDAE
uniref:Uncharacterized protein n=1 Tax=Panagrolaimus sp. PS1159 TaxID=55785 RepID=A0AC35GWI5_9BILA